MITTMLFARQTAAKELRFITMQPVVIPDLQIDDLGLIMDLTCAESSVAGMSLVVATSWILVTATVIAYETIRISTTNSREIHNHLEDRQAYSTLILLCRICMI